MLARFGALLDPDIVLLRANGCGKASAPPVKSQTRLSSCATSSKKGTELLHLGLEHAGGLPDASPELDNGQGNDVGGEAVPLLGGALAHLPVLVTSIFITGGARSEVRDDLKGIGESDGTSKSTTSPGDTNLTEAVVASARPMSARTVGSMSRPKMATSPPRSPAARGWSACPIRRASAGPRPSTQSHGRKAPPTTAPCLGTTRGGSSPRSHQGG